MTNAHSLIATIEAAAKELGISPSTVGERAGQGGQFYSRLMAGKRVWPETEAKVLAAIDRMRAPLSEAS